MLRSLPFIAVVLLAFPGHGQSKSNNSTSIDPGGCVLDHIAVEPGIRQYQYDGLSFDGKRLAIGWERDEEDRGTYILDLENQERMNLSGMNNGAVFAPDGKTLVNSVYEESGKTDIVEYELKTGKITTVALHPDWDWLASYSSDGNTILFNSYRTGSSDIYTYNKQTQQLKRWTDFDGYDAHAQFSPDDSKILFNRHEGGSDYNLYVIDTSDGQVSQLTEDKTEEGYGSWSPDGKTIAFASDRDKKPGTGDIYLMDADGSNIRQLTDMDTKDGYPFFSPDGRYLYFNSLREAQGVYRITLDDELNCVKAKR
ncbi:MAG: DPP IV N-terminal domain-containing protein [Pseudomonadota bacterium]